MYNIDQKFEFLAKKYPKAYQICFLPIFPERCTPSTLLDWYKWGG